jgi:hypothetical protein
VSLQFFAKKRCTIVLGSSGSGKTTFVLRYLVADKLRVRWIFDAEGELSHRLQIPAVTSLEEIPFAMEDGFVIFDPHPLFPGKMEEAFEWFCATVFKFSEENPSRNSFFIDEAWKYLPPNKVSQPLRDCIQTGRRRGIEMIFAAQQPNRLNEVITNECTELVCFRLQGENALARVESLGANPSIISNLPLGSYIARNCETGREIAGKLW